nr:hypothetical protein [Tanacetum cinerariifolium]
MVNGKAESSQATPKAQSTQAKAPRSNAIVGVASQYKNLATNCVEKKFGTRTTAEGSKRKGKRRVGGYESKKYSDAEDAAGTNRSDRKIVKWGITRLYKFRREYGKPGGIKIKKEANDKIKEGTLNLDDGTDAITVVFGKEKGGYAREVVSGVTYKSERQQKVVLVKKLSIEMTEKDLLVKKLSNEITETKRMLSQLMNQLAAQGVQLNLSSQLSVASYVSPMAINNIESSAYEVDGTQTSVVVRDKDARIKKKSNGLVTSEKEPVKTVGPKKMPKS